MSKTIQILIAVGVLVLAGCSGGSAEASAIGGAVRDASTAAAMVATTPQAKAQSSLPRKVIYKGSIDLVAENLDVAASKLEAKVKEVGGYIGDANKQGDKGTIRTASWTVRIPSDKFDVFVGYVSGLGELQSNKRESQDVSEEFYDVAARLKNKRVEEARLIELLKQSRNQLSDVLVLEKELNCVREECEQIEGRLKFLTNQTDLSTITITMRERTEFKPETSPNVNTQVSRTFGASMDAMKQLGVGILLLIVAVGPWIIPLAVVGLVARKVIRAMMVTKPPVQTVPFDIDQK